MSDPLADYTNLSQDETDPSKKDDNVDDLPDFEDVVGDNDIERPTQQEEEEQQQQQETEKDEVPAQEERSNEEEPQNSEPIEDVLSTMKVAKLADGQVGDGYVKKHTGLKEDIIAHLMMMTMKKKTMDTIRIIFLMMMIMTEAQEVDQVNHIIQMMKLIMKV